MIVKQIPNSSWMLAGINAKNKNSEENDMNKKQKRKPLKNTHYKNNNNNNNNKNMQIQNNILHTIIQNFRRLKSWRSGVLA